jgi:hypothetical protein
VNQTKNRSEGNIQNEDRFVTQLKGITGYKKDKVALNLAPRHDV